MPTNGSSGVSDGSGAVRDFLTASTVRLAGQAVVRRWRDAPTLARVLREADESPRGLVVERAAEVILYRIGLTALGVGVGGSVLLIVVAAGLTAQGQDPISTWVPTVVVVVLLAGAGLLMFVDSNRAAKVSGPVMQLMGVLAFHEVHALRWQQLRHRGAINVRLERVARSYERLSATAHPGDPDTARFVLGLMRGAAADVRALKKWVISPQSLTYTDLAARLGAHLELALQDRWHELPSSEPTTAVPRVSGLQRYGWIVAGCLLLVAAAAVFVWAAELGAIGTVGPTLFFGLAIAALVRAGLPLQELLTARAAVDQLRGK